MFEYSENSPISEEQETYVTGYEKIDCCDNKLKSSKHAVKSINLN